MRSSSAGSRGRIRIRPQMFGLFSICLGCVVGAGAPSGIANAEESPPTIVQNIAVSADVLAFSPDGARLASGTYDGQIQLWDVATGRLLRTILGYTDAVQALAFSADGKHLLSSSDGDEQSGNKTVMEWDVQTGRPISGTNIKSNGRFSAVAISSLKNTVLTGDSFVGLKEWDASTGKLLRTFPKFLGGVWGVAYSSNVSRLIAADDASEAHTVKTLDATTGRLLATIPWQVDRGRQYIWGVALSPDGALAASGIWNSEFADTKHSLQSFDVKISEATTGKTLHTLSGHVGGGKVHSLAFSPDGRYLGSLDLQGTLRIWRTDSGHLIHELLQGDNGAVEFSPDGAFVAASGAGIKVWDVQTGNLVRAFGYVPEVKPSSYSIRSSAYLSDGTQIITGGSRLRIWDSQSLRSVQSLPPPVPGATTMLITTDGKLALWQLSDHATLVATETTSGRLIATFKGHTGFVLGAAVSSDQKLIVSAGEDKTARIWEVSTGRLIKTLSFEYAPLSVAISPDGRFVLCNDSRGMQLWNVAAGTLVRSFPLKSDTFWDMAFSPEGAYAFSANKQVVRQWDLTTGLQVRAFAGKTKNIRRLVVSPDAKRLMSLGDDSKIKLWDVRTGELLQTIERAGTASISFSPDGKRALLDQDIYDLGTGQLLAGINGAFGLEWVSITPEGFFDASENGASLLSVVRGLEVYGIDQFYQALYRPDLVREKLAGDPRGLVREAAAQLDMNKVLATGNAPDVRINLPGRALGAGTIDATQIQAQAEINDRGGGIGRVEWRVNGVTAGVDTPPPAPRGLPARLTRNLALDPGTNDIAVVAYNSSNLIASVPSRLSVATVQPTAPAPSPGTAPQPAPVGPQPKLFVLVAGVNDYADKRIQLSYAVADAKEVARGFKEAAGNLYQSVEVKLMTDADVTRDKLDAAFNEIVAKAQASDVFVLYLAGHGKTVDGRYYFIPHDFTVNGELSDTNINATVKAKAIAQDQLQRWFASVLARRSVILFDTCDSGTLTGDAGTTQQLERGAANDRLAQATGRSIITASSGSQEALEGYRGHGLFTYQMLDALNRADGDGNGTIEVTELAAYVYAAVSELSLKVFKQQQAPQMKITANYALTKQTRILQDELVPVADAKPAFQLQQTAQLQIQPGPGAAVVRSLSAKMPVTVLENKNGWALIASEGKPLGYVAARDLAPIQ
jgi:WD40 repeat protein/uncharacterized caspase-like protein